MKKIFLLILLVASVTRIQSYAIENDGSSNNRIQLDSIGNRVAVWNEGLLSVYNNGILDGPDLSFSRKIYDDRTYVAALSFFKDGKYKGSQIFFHPNGVVSILRINIEPNKDFIGAQKVYTKESIFPYQAYRYEFYDNGKLFCEGWEIIGEQTEIDDEKVGVWKYYDENGNCELVDFSNDDIDEKYCRY